MKIKAIILLFILSFTVLLTSAFAQRTPEKIVDKVKANFLKIKDAKGDLILDYNLCLFGCAGTRRLSGEAYYMAPDKLWGTNQHGNSYYARGNRILKVTKDGKKYNIKLLNAPNLAPGFHPGIIPYNFNLTLIKDDAEEIVIEGIPKPGILKNITKVTFYIDPKEYLLRKLHLTLINNRLSGDVFIKYKKIKGIWVPYETYGKSAIELSNHALIGLGFKLKTKNIKINTGFSGKSFKL
ncbi:MAG: hypothetical protein U9R38_07915 [Candidatus Margulisiibacteriota bacterium]|nr:hypothetical protein [Candidatus Margulisiibacteriota bacterium]